MDLFAAAGIELGSGRRGPASAARSLRVPLLSRKVIEAARRTAGSPGEDRLAAARDYARKVLAPKFAKQAETAVRNLFFEEVLGRLLGYRTYDPEVSYTLAFERAIRNGKVDVALGRFGGGTKDEIVAPFEMKGPGFDNLDAVMPGRGISPVQQAWNYAIDAPGCSWVLVSNCIEMRLYGFGRGREAYEVFDLKRLDEEDEVVRLWLLLSADRLLGGGTDALLAETDAATKDITAELYAEYSALRARLIQFLVDSADGPKLAPLAAIEIAQKLLDRILFIAFAQRTDLLRDGLLKRAVEARNEFTKDPIWNNFRQLFRFLDKGEHDWDISAYNGGLFAPDPVADAIVLPDELAEALAALDRWDYGTEVPVTILGHIFEQSITDIEKLRADSAGRPAPRISKRKREGVVYTPDLVTRFLVERTVGLTLEERRAALLARHAQAGAALESGATIAWHDGETSERAFWRDYLADLRGLTIVDPACGSGAFLVAAFDLLAAEYRRSVERLASLGEPLTFDLFDEILTKNLHGVDLNAESVEITRLSLWLKTARRKHRLQNLEATIKVGNSLIDEPAFTDRPFDWRAAFPDIFGQGGFDIVIGNPPYVRMELIKPIKPYLEREYVVAADRADLYAYFFERGVKLLKPGGRLGFISSSTFFRTGSGENLRTFLGDGVAVESVVDFGDLQLFEDVTTYPAILTLRRGATDGGDVAFLNVRKELPTDLIAAFREGARPMRRARLGAGSWRFEDEPLARLRDKIVMGRPTLGEVFGAPLYGIKTGLNEAFVIDRATRDRLVAADPRSADLLKPFLRGEDIKRWRVEPEGLFLINTPKGKVDIDAFPAIRGHLLPFRPELEGRATQQQWFELQQAQLAYQPLLEGPKLCWPHFQDARAFTLESAGHYLNNKCFFFPGGDAVLASLLNSRGSWFQLSQLARIKRGGYIEAEAQYVGQLAWPIASAAENARLAALGETSTAAAGRRFEVRSAVRHRIRDLAPPERFERSSGRLDSWWTLDFAAFRKEVKRLFRTDIPLKERAEWESYLAHHAAEVARLTQTIESAERDIDAIVYRFFDLDDDEIALLETSIAGQY